MFSNTNCLSRTDPDIRTSFVELLESGAILQPEVSAVALGHARGHAILRFYMKVLNKAMRKLIYLFTLESNEFNRW
jgi:hypothetical protein